MSDALSQSPNQQHDRRVEERSDMNRATPFQQWSALASAFWRGKLNRWIKDSMVLALKLFWLHARHQTR